MVLHLPSISVESETGQGLRCSIEKCGKLFRNDRLLQQHVKHYHPDVFDQVINFFVCPMSINLRNGYFYHNCDEII